ncbi:MAG TPA: amidohydrolase family protein [Planctomycetota bacterium]|nr:amidohydrolase family protein [Planctomycetota bacterium]
MTRTHDLRAPLSLLLVGTLALPAAATGGDLLAIRVGRAETISDGTLEHAVILVEGGKIAAIGQDLPIERGIQVLDRPGWTVMPGLVHPYSRMGLDGRGGAGFDPEVVPTGELYPLDPVYGDLLERGVTTLGLYPAGNNVPGQAIVVRPHGDEREEMLISEGAYLKIEFRSDARSKKTIRDAFAKVDDYIEKEKKAREKWESEVEKSKKKKKDDDKKDDKKDEKKDESSKDKTAADDGEKKDEGPGPYVPPEVEPKVKPFMDLREGKLRALVGLDSASDYLHWLDAIGEEEFAWDLRVPMVRYLDLYEVADKLGERKVRLLLEPEITLQPSTLRQRNLPAELVGAGARLALLPRSDSLGSVETWLTSVGVIVSAGLDRQVGLRSVTLEAAEVLGMAERVGSLEVGKDANLIFFDGDPLQPASRLRAVMLEGEFVMGEVNN